MSSEHETSRPDTSRPGSTVLARMIQRTREPVPSLEPVIQPLFAADAGAVAPGARSRPRGPGVGSAPA